MNRMQFMKGLQKRGYSRLGTESTFSTVWVKSDANRVIKVGRLLEDGWFNYITWAMSKGYVGNHAPMVYSFKVKTGSDKISYFIAVVERFYPLNDENLNLRYQLTNDDKFRKYVPLEWKQFSQDFTAKFGTCCDMHKDNWMQRKNGELVLNDPIGYSKTTDVRRYKSGPHKTPSSLRHDPNLVWC